MKKTRVVGRAVAIGGACLVLSAAAAAQQHARPAPTAADWAALARLPDFTGVWEIPLGGPARGAAPRGGGPGAAGARGGGARPVPARPSLTPAYAARKQAYDARAAEDTEAANCLPPGMPGIMGQPYPMEFLMTPGQVTIVIEAYSQVRHIYTDGRPLPDDPDPKFHGTSVGRWEGDTLVVETVGFSPQTEIDRGVPHSDKMRIRERFRLADPDTMSIETTITDPEALTAPYTTTRVLKRHRNWTIAEYVCEENNRNSVDAGGKAKIDLSLPAADPAKKNP